MNIVTIFCESCHFPAAGFIWKTMPMMWPSGERPSMSRRYSHLPQRLANSCWSAESAYTNTSMYKYHIPMFTLSSADCGVRGLLPRDWARLDQPRLSSKPRLTRKRRPPNSNPAVRSDNTDIHHRSGLWGASWCGIRGCTSRAVPQIVPPGLQLAVGGRSSGCAAALNEFKYN